MMAESGRRRNHGLRLQRSGSRTHGRGRNGPARARDDTRRGDGQADAQAQDASKPTGGGDPGAFLIPPRGQGGSRAKRGTTLPSDEVARATPGRNQVRSGTATPP
jgi:hypothetical protein